MNNKQFIIGILLPITFAVTLCLNYVNPNLNKADLFEPQVTGGINDIIYMPSYYADIGEEGLIEIKVKDAMKPFDGISFLMGYSPEQYLSFSNNPLVFDNTTLFKNIASQSVTPVQPGLLQVTVLLQQPIAIEGVILNDPTTHKTLFKLRTQVSQNTPNDQNIDVSFKGVVISNEGSTYEDEIVPSTILVTNKFQADEFSNVSVSSVEPTKISNKSDANVVFKGNDLDLVNEVWVGKGVQNIISKTPTSLTIKIPANKLSPDIYAITFYDKAQNELTLKTQLEVTEEVIQQQEEQKQEEEQELKPAPNIVPSGDSPKIIPDKTYTNPSLAINDGKTPVSLYVLVEDKNNDIKSVIADLTKIGQVGPENPGALGQDKNNVTPETCPTGSNFVACMEPAAKQGQNGQWFVLPNVTISSTVKASTTPYKIDVTAIDSKGNKDKKQVSVYVGDKNAVPLKVMAVVSTSKTSVEMMFNRPVTASTTGKGFTITSSSNVEDKLNVTHATTNAAGNVVTLTTADQVPAKKYVLSASAEIKDTGGNPVQGAYSKKAFDGFQALNRPPVLNYVSATGVNKVRLEFQRNLKLSSILDAVIKIYESENSQKRLNVVGVTAISGRILEVETNLQTPEKPYRINIEGLVSYDGTTLPAAINKGFTGYNLPLTVHIEIVRRADFNNDKRVDFADFTIFSSVYGAVYFGEGENIVESLSKSESQASEAIKIGQPLLPDPDSLVPHTTEP